MLASYFKSPSRVQTLLTRPGGPLLDAFAQYLNRSGFTTSTACNHLRAAEHLLVWADRTELPVSELNDAVLARFAEHLDRCRCKAVGHPSKQVSLCGVKVFLAYRHAVGDQSAGVEQSAADPGSALFTAFCRWMRQQRGTAESTLHNYRVALRGLLGQVADDPSRLDAQRLRQFILEQSRQKGWAAAKKCTTALRMFIRFLITEGKCPAGLDSAIPVLAHWRLSALPRYLQTDEVERVIAACDAHTMVGLRDRAILLLLSRLGLRAGDILQMRIADIDWRGAWITVSGKSRRQTRLPLTQEVGQALVDYLQRGRPATDSDVLFVRARAPYRAFASHSAISVIVAQAMLRAGVACPSRGAAHVLRHSAATGMLRHGASLQDIAAVLRHSSITTTQIYAKVDVAALRQIAQPWPGEQPC